MKYDLCLSTTASESIVELRSADGTILAQAKIALRDQTEFLLAEIDRMMAESRIERNEIAKVVVRNTGQSLTGLRISIVVANSLAFAWNIPVELPEHASGRQSTFSGFVVPAYQSEPHITKPKH